MGIWEKRTLRILLIDCLPLKPATMAWAEHALDAVAGAIVHRSIEEGVDVQDCVEFENLSDSSHMLCFNVGFCQI